MDKPILYFLYYYIHSFESILYNIHLIYIENAVNIVCSRCRNYLFLRNNKKASFLYIVLYCIPTYVAENLYLFTIFDEFMVKNTKKKKTIEN